MEPNTVRQLDSLTETKTQTNKVQTAVELNTKSVPFSGFEKSLVCLIGLIVIIMMYGLVHLRTQTIVQQHHAQDLAEQTQKVLNSNTDLHQEIIELSNSGRLLKIAQKHNLQLHSDNIRNISK